MFDPEAAVFDVVVNLAFVDVPAPTLQSVFTHAEASKRANTGTTNVVGDVVGVVLVFLAAVLVHETGQVQARAKFTQHRLEAAHIAVGFDHWPADRICHAVRLADRAVEQRDTVVPFQICRVGQHQIGIGHHFGRIGV